MTDHDIPGWRRFQRRQQLKRLLDVLLVAAFLLGFLLGWGWWVYQRDAYLDAVDACTGTDTSEAAFDACAVKISRAHREARK